MKYSGKFGFVTTVETSPDVFTPKIVEKTYRGDIYNISYKNKQSNAINDDKTVSLELSVVADLFLNQEIGNLEYITFRGHKWKVNSFNPAQSPRMTINVSELYNG